VGGKGSSWRTGTTSFLTPVPCGTCLPAGRRGRPENFGWFLLVYNDVMEIEVKNTSGLAPYTVQIEKLVKSTLKEVGAKFNLNDVSVVVKEAEHPNDLKDIGGVGGYCPSGELVELSLDVNHPVFKKLWGQLVRRSLLHELHHAARRQAGIATGESSFLECLFSEGLADHFVYDLTNLKPVWAIDLDKGTLAKLQKRAKEIFNQPMTDQLYEDWFTEGSEELNIPRWAGYTLGYKLVDDYLAEHSGTSAASLVALPAQF